jgi:hypothetical protein
MPEEIFNPKPRLGISACLLGEKVRYDGGDRKDYFLRTATPASPGRLLESTIVPGDRSDRYTAKSVTCPMTARRGNSTARLTLNESRFWKKIA